MSAALRSAGASADFRNDRPPASPAGRRIVEEKPGAGTHPHTAQPRPHPTSHAIPTATGMVRRASSIE